VTLLLEKSYFIFQTNKKVAMNVICRFSILPDKLTRDIRFDVDITVQDAIGKQPPHQ